MISKLEIATLRNHASGYTVYTVSPRTHGIEVEYTLDRDGVEIPLLVCGSPVPFVAGRYWGDPASCYPDDGGYCEDVMAFLNRHGCWVPYSLTRDEERSIGRYIIEADQY